MRITGVWSEQETATLYEMKAARFSEVAIAARINRTVHAVNERWRWVNMTEEAKQARRERVNAARCVKRNLQGHTRKPTSQFNLVIPESVFEDRNRRINTPRSLGAELMGDPHPGYSALDRRMPA